MTSCKIIYQTALDWIRSGVREYKAEPYPSLSKLIGFSPGGISIKVAKPFMNDSLIGLLFVPGETSDSVNHLLGTDNPTSAPVRNAFQKGMLLVSQADD